MRSRRRLYVIEKRPQSAAFVQSFGRVFLLYVIEKRPQSAAFVQSFGRVFLLYVIEKRPQSAAMYSRSTSVKHCM